MKVLIGLVLLAAVGLFAWYYFTRTEPGTVGEKAKEAATELKDDVKQTTHDIAQKIADKTHTATNSPATQP